MAIFQGNFKKGEMFQYEGKWWIVIEHGVYQNAADLEDGFDIFLPGSGYYTDAREATPDEIIAHDGMETEKHQQALGYAQSFAIGCSIKRKGSTTGRVAKVIGVDYENSLLNFTNFGSEVGSNWGRAVDFEIVS